MPSVYNFHESLPFIMAARIFKKHCSDSILLKKGSLFFLTPTFDGTQPKKHLTSPKKTF